LAVLLVGFFEYDTRNAVQVYGKVRGNLVTGYGLGGIGDEYGYGLKAILPSSILNEVKSPAFEQRPRCYGGSF